MGSSSIEAEFARYCATGSPEALGRVFDEVAPGLLCVASQLAPGHAEDALQETFLTAIERRASWDPQRPLRPWLVGILAHEVRRLRRRERRKVDPDRIEVAAPSEPPELAATVELAQQASEAIESLPEPFRQVCVLRLVHGLDPTQIARSLGVPAATVRSRMHRALERLRGALPAGVATGLAVLLQSGSLSAARETVLRGAARAARPAALSAAAVSWGAYVMKNKLLGAVFLLLVVAAAAVAWPNTFATSAAAPPPPSTAGALAESSQAGAVEEAPVAQAPVRAPSRADAGPQGRVFRGVVLGDAGGGLRPVEGASVRVVARYMQPGDGLVLGVAQTGAAGRFELRTDALADLDGIGEDGLQLVARAERDGWIPASGAIADASARLVLTPVRGEVRGRVVDAVGRPVVGAELDLQRVDGGGDRGIAGVGIAGLRLPPVSGPDGTFRVFYDSPGDYFLRARAVDVGAYERRLVGLDAASARELGDLELLGAYDETLAVRLVLGDGSPIAGVGCDVGLVEPHAGPGAAAAGALRRRASTTSDDDGRVNIHGLRPGGYVLELEGIAEGFEVRTGAPRTELRVEAQLITLRMVGADGALLPNADLSGDRWSGEAPFRASSSTAAATEPSDSFSMLARSGSTQLLSPFGGTWLFLGIRPGGSVPIETAHDVRSGIYRAQVDLRMDYADDDARGEVALVVLDAAGERIEPLRAHALLPLSRWQLDDDRVPSDAARGWTLPAGNWSISIDAGELVQGVALFPRITRDVFVAPGSRQELVIWAGQPQSMLKLALKWPEPTPDRAIERLTLRLAGGVVDCTGRYRQRDAEDGYEASPFGPAVDLSEPFLLPPVGPGAGELELRVRGCEPVRRAFVAKPGAVTLLEIELREQR